MTSESLSLGRGQQDDAREEENAPIEGLWGDSLETVALLPPGAPGGVFETDAVCNLVLETGHVAPGAPDVFLAPFVGEVVDLAAGEV